MSAARPTPYARGDLRGLRGAVEAGSTPTGTLSETRWRNRSYWGGSSAREGAASGGGSSASRNKWARSTTSSPSAVARLPRIWRGTRILPAGSSHVYQVMLTPAGVATSSRRSPGVRSRLKVGSPASAGVRRAPQAAEELGKLTRPALRRHLSTTDSPSDMAPPDAGSRQTLGHRPSQSGVTKVNRMGPDRRPRNRRDRPRAFAQPVPPHRALLRGLRPGRPVHEQGRQRHVLGTERTRRERNRR
jgi:hypothetical protein